MDGIDTEDLTIEQYLELTQNHAPSVANIRAGINISTREVSLGIKRDKETQTDVYDTDLNESCSQDNQSHDELSYGAYNTNSKTHWCEPVRQEHNTRYTLWTSYDPYHETCDGGGLSGEKMKHYWKSTNDDDRMDLEWEGLSYANWVKARHDKLPEEWFSGVSKDMDDLEGIIDYLEPTLYEGFIDHNDEAYKRRRNKLLGMPYTEPPPIIKEELK
ncbi:hypothetical protein Tco_0969196 [Tanacetum coccineum]